MEIDELYQDIILDHYKNPHNFGEGDASCTDVELDNPVLPEVVVLLALPRHQL